MIKTMKLSCLAALMLLVLSCAGTGGPAPGDKSANKAAAAPRETLSISTIINTRMKAIDLRRFQLTCAGNKREIIDRVEGVAVKGLVCGERHYVSFAYLFNDEPFFFAIMEINEARDEQKPLAGFGAFERRGILTPVDLKGKPRLPGWAYDKDGRPLKSIYTYPSP